MCIFTRAYIDFTKILNNISTMASYGENNSNVEVKWKLCYQMKQYANNVF